MLPKFELYMPDTMEEACRLKAEGAEVVAGGTDVFVNMHGGKDRSGKVVDIKNIPTLQGHTFDEAQGLDLGALTTHREIELWDVIKKHYRAMFEGCSRVGSVQIRTRGTLGGNICNGAPSADSIGPMLVHDARVVAAGPAGEREIPLHNFYPVSYTHLSTAMLMPIMPLPMMATERSVIPSPLTVRPYA